MADIVALIYTDHDWLRRQFFLLDDARSPAELAAIWEPLSARLDTHAEAEEVVFYPALLKKGRAGDPRDETEDAIEDHNKIRNAVAAAAQLKVGSATWFDAVGQARTENGKHLDEEEREALPDFIKSASPQVRHDLAMSWLQFYQRHPAGRGIPGADKDAGEYIAKNS
jgi:hypothetical protein